MKQQNSYRVPYDLVEYVHENGRLPVVNFAAGGVATPADAALMMQLGAEGVFVGSGIFKSGNPEEACGFYCKSSYELHRCQTACRTFSRLRRSYGWNQREEIQLLMAERGK